MEPSKTPTPTADCGNSHEKNDGGREQASDPWIVAVLSLSAGNMHNLSGTCAFVNEGIAYLKFQVLVEGITFSFIFWYNYSVTEKVVRTKLYSVHA